MCEQVEIREYQRGDKPFLMDLLKLNTPKYFAIAETQDFELYLDNEIELYFIIQIERRILGCGGINFSENKSVGKISWDMVHPEYHGKLLGTKLLTHRIEKIKSIQKIQKIAVRTSQFAYRFYGKHGFKLINVIKDYWAPGYDMYYMEYRLL